MNHIVKILSVINVTHDVRRYVVRKPEGYTFVPGQATDVSINKDEWKDLKRPFTFTSLNQEENLEFTIKSYPDHHGVTEQIGKLDEGDELIIGEPWGAINYKGKGTFIAGGAGITPFIAILKELKADNALVGNMLIFSNKTSQDVLLEDMFQSFFQDKPTDLILTLTREEKSGYEFGHIDKVFLRKYITDFNQHFYICGPSMMVQEIKSILLDLGAQVESVVVEG